MTKHTYNSNYFNKIDSRDKAYILGLILSDGCISKNERQVRLSLTDIDLLETVKDRLEFTGPLYIKNKNRKETYKECKSLIICSKKMCSDLMSLNCHHNKSYNLEFPQIEKEFLGDFVRGFFDGDGCIYLGKQGGLIFGQVSIIATLNFCKSLKEIFNLLNINCYVDQDKRHDDRIASIKIKNISGIRKFYNFIYYNIEDQIFLNRKHDKFIKFLQNVDKRKIPIKITLEDAKIIRDKFSTGNITKRQLAIEYNIDESYMGDIVKNKCRIYERMVNYE